jgi:VIT1/CCC1 family predicted Fe2+/Mn2+ transporter
MQHGHSREEIIARCTGEFQASYLRDWVYGGIDGTVTTFAVVAGVIGADLSVITLFILGFANLVGDGFSMAAANFVGTQSEREEHDYYKAIEEMHTDTVPEGEVEEVRQLFKRKGFVGDDLERIVAHIISDRKLWIDTMLKEEYGLSAGIRNPLKAASFTFIAFTVCGFVPLLPFLFKMSQAFLTSCVATGILFFLIGSLKSKWSIKPWWKLGLQTFLIGTIAAGLAYAVGLLFRVLM